MKEIFDEFEPKLKELKPNVKEKALEIAAKLLTEKILSKENLTVDKEQKSNFRKIK